MSCLLFIMYYVLFIIYSLLLQMQSQQIGRDAKYQRADDEVSYVFTISDFVCISYYFVFGMYYLLFRMCYCVCII